MRKYVNRTKLLLLRETRYQWKRAYENNGEQALLNSKLFFY